MIGKILILTFAIALTACEQWDQPVYQKTAYEKQPPLDYNMNCKQISKALIEARASLERIKERRNTTTDEDVTAFVLSLGTPSYAGVIAQKDAEDRIATLESAAISRRCIKLPNKESE